jgi:hypothetical protein
LLVIKTKREGMEWNQTIGNNNKHYEQEKEKNECENFTNCSSYAAQPQKINHIS